MAPTIDCIFRSDDKASVFTATSILYLSDFGQACIPQRFPLHISFYGAGGSLLMYDFSIQFTPLNEGWILSIEAMLDNDLWQK